MTFVPGQGILGRIKFVDGKMPDYNRTYLVVKVFNEYIEVLNVSSIEGKEYKLSFKTNEKIQHYLPPFRKPSFVKLDSLTRVYRSSWYELRILSNGQTLDVRDLNNILSKLVVK